MEQWKDVPGFEGRYQVSDQGRVRNVKGRVLKPQLVNSGYHVVHLVPAPRSRKIALVHRLVALAFLPSDPDRSHVNHKDFDRLNNWATNLEWVTPSENMLHAFADGRANPPRCAVVGRALDGSHELRFSSQLAAEKAIAGRASSAVHHCLVGKKKSAYGYVWSRA